MEFNLSEIEGLAMTVLSVSLRATLSGHEVADEGERGNPLNKTGCVTLLTQCRGYQEIASRSLS